jgi:hypothetical protein
MRRCLHLAAVLIVCVSTIAVLAVGLSPVPGGIPGCTAGKANPYWC